MTKIQSEEKGKTVNFIHEIVVVNKGERLCGEERRVGRRKKYPAQKVLEFLRFCDVYNLFMCVFYGFALSLAAGRPTERFLYFSFVFRRTPCKSGRQSKFSKFNDIIGGNFYRFRLLTSKEGMNWRQRNCKTIPSNRTSPHRGALRNAIPRTSLRYRMSGVECVFCELKAIGHKPSDIRPSDALRNTRAAESTAMDSTRMYHLTYAKHDKRNQRALSRRRRGGGGGEGNRGSSTRFMHG